MNPNEWGQVGPFTGMSYNELMRKLPPVDVERLFETLRTQEELRRPKAAPVAEPFHFVSF